MKLPQEMGDVLKVIMNSAKYGIIEQQRAAASSWTHLAKGLSPLSQFHDNSIHLHRENDGKVEQENKHLASTEEMSGSKLYHPRWMKGNPIQIIIT